MNTRLTILVGTLAAAAALGTAASAQICGGQWLPGSTSTNITGNTVYDFVVDGTGDLIAGGLFTAAGGVGAANVARWDGAGWAPIGAGFTGEVRALAIGLDGTLYAGGAMTMSGDEFIGRIAKWTGSEWFRVGVSADATNSVMALAVMPNGDLIAAGTFTQLSGTSLNRVARWDGTQWTPLGDGFNNNSSVYALAVLPNGDLIAAGALEMSGKNPVHSVVRWDGTSWTTLGPLTGGAVNALAVMPNGDLIAAGSFANFAGDPNADRIARWDGTQWHALGTGIESFLGVYSLSVLANGDLIAVGNFNHAGGVPVANIARWNGTSWSAMSTGIGNSGLSSIQLPSGELAVGGIFSSPSRRFARWSETGIPAIGVQPESASDNTGGTVVLTASATAGYTGVSVQWQRDGANIADGPGGASAGGGTVSGASGALPSPTTGSIVTLTITGAQPSDAGDYTAVFSNTCGEAETAIAEVVISGGGKCPSDFNHDGTVNSTDVSDFINQWFQDQVDGTLVTDWDLNGVINSTDVSEFINSWFEDTAAGCG